jgi:hypothetical protein
MILLGTIGAATGAGAADFQWGVNGHPFSQAAYVDVPKEVQLDLVAGLGAGWYRVDLTAAEFAADTAGFDDFLAGATRRGIQVLPVLISSPGPGDAEATPERIRAAAFAFGSAVATRYRGRVTHWELGNELDAVALLRKGDRKHGGTLWTWGDPDGSHWEDYEDGRYAQARAEIMGLLEGIRSADPKALVVVDTAGWLHYGFIERLVDQDRVPFDILAWHWYSEMGDMTRVQGRLDLVAYLQRYGKPLWLTEVSRRGGSGDGGGQALADFIGRDVRRLAENPGIGALFLYELLDEPYFGAGEGHYGLVEVARDGSRWVPGRPKAAYESYRAVIARPPVPGPR